MRPENLLFVDDNELLRSLMVRFFQKEFQRVMAVGTGEEAMKLVLENFYHIVILDKKLPDIDGLNVLEYIREKSPHSRVVMITSNVDEDVRQEALRKGAFEFFEKPFDINKLKSALRGMRIFTALKVSIGADHEGTIYNLSDSGMLVVTDGLFECGADVDILILTPEGRKIPLRGKVARTCDSSVIGPTPPPSDYSGKYAVGIKLLDPPQDYHSLVDTLIL